MTLVEITEVLKQIFMFLFVIVGILAVLTLAYAIVAGFIKTLQDSINQIQDGSTQLKNGTDELLTGVNTISSKLPSEEDNKSNEQKLTYLKGQNESTITKLTQANKQLEAQVKEVDGKLTYVKNQKVSVEAQKKTVDANVKAAKDAYDEKKELLDGLNQLKAAKAAYGQLPAEKEAQLQALLPNEVALNTAVPLLENQYKA